MNTTKSILLASAAFCLFALQGDCLGGVPSAEELYSRMWDSYQAGLPRSGEGVYVRKVTNPSQVTRQQAQAEVDATIAGLREQSKSWPSARQAELKGQVDDIRKKLLEQRMQTDHTVVERYYISGDKYRIDRWIQDSAESMSNVAKAAKKTIASPPDYQIVWDGEKLATWDHQSLKGLNPPGVRAPESRLVWTSQKLKAPDFLMQGRVLPSADMLENFRKSGVAMDVVPVRRADGEDALMLRIGTPGSVGFYLETVVLPNKGYVMASALVKMNGVVMSEDVFGGFVEVSPGVWVATEVSQKATRLDKNRVPYLSSQLEAIAVEKPVANCVIDESVFDIRPTSSTLVADRRVGQSQNFVVPGLKDEEDYHILSPANVPVDPVSNVDEAATSGVAQKRPVPAAGREEAQERRNRELAIRPLVFGACLTVGAIVGIYLLARRRRSRGK